MCNGTLEPVAKDELEAEVPPRVLAVFDRFWRCGGCGRVYWEGSHYDRLSALVGQLERIPDGRSRFVRR